MKVTAPNVYFEPYFVARTQEITKFDERYRGNVLTACTVRTHAHEAYGMHMALARDTCT